MALGSGRQSYTQILKATALMGGSSMVNIAFSIVRTKAMAVLLGPTGVGLMGLYNSVADFTQVLAGFGLQASGVRQIAEAVGTGDSDRIAQTAAAVRQTSLALGVIGALLLAIFALPIAEFSLGDPGHAIGVALLSLAIFFRLAGDGQIALVQGLRMISTLARINVLAGLFSTLISLPMVYFFGTDGIVPSLIAVALFYFLTAWWYGRQVNTTAKAGSAWLLGQEAVALLKLGFVFMVTGLLTAGTAYAIRIIVLRADGVAAAGLYQAAWSMGGLYAAFILQAMGTDFYPRLTAVAGNHSECNQLVNEQAHISMLLAGTGLLATLTLAPLAIGLLYSAEFYAAVAPLRWICLGMMLRIIAWPMGFIVLAKGARAILFWTETAAALVHVGLAWILVAKFGLSGAGAAFFGLYVWHTVVIYFIVRRLTGFRLSLANRKLGLIFLTSSGLVFCSVQLLPVWQATALGTVATVLSGIYSLRMLLDVLPPGSLSGLTRVLGLKRISTPS
ncbi:O-antigen translocase [Rhizobium sp. RAF56]|uniref:O-antigen translocase n=1 Tax=Rhizobium sp. RAF56 TaxID=3233062 RepID=UPI003F96D55B